MFSIYFQFFFIVYIFFPTVYKQVYFKAQKKLIHQGPNFLLVNGARGFKKEIFLCFEEIEKLINQKQYSLMLSITYLTLYKQISIRYCYGDPVLTRKHSILLVCLFSVAF